MKSLLRCVARALSLFNAQTPVIMWERAANGRDDDREAKRQKAADELFASEYTQIEFRALNRLARERAKIDEKKKQYLAEQCVVDDCLNQALVSTRGNLSRDNVEVLMHTCRHWLGVESRQSAMTAPTTPIQPDSPGVEASDSESDEPITPTEEGDVSNGPTSGGTLHPGVKLCETCRHRLKAVLAHEGVHNRLSAFRACGKCMSTAISVCPPCAATDIHGDGTKRHNDGHGTVNYFKLRENKTPLLQIVRHNHPLEDGKLVCKQCYTKLNKKRKRRFNLF